MCRQIATLIFLVMTFCLPTIARGQDPTQETPSPRISDVRVKGDEGDERQVNEFGLDDTLLVTVDHWKPLNEELTEEILDQWLLKLDGITLPGTSAVAIDTTVSPGKAIIRFHLKRNAGNSVQWDALLRRPLRDGWVRPVRVGIQAPQEFGEIAPLAGMNLIVLDEYRFYPLLVFMLVVIAVLVRLGIKSNILRGKRGGVYSLGRTQMAWWFLIILGSYLVLGVLTFDWSNTISNSALILMGISGATALGATMIEGDKEKRAVDAKAQRERLPEQIEAFSAKIQQASGAEATALNSELREMTNKLAQASAAATDGEDRQSEGFFKDLISDKDGVSLHRFQNVIWTLVLGVCFALSVLADLSMPEFNTTLLSLMGISSGTYVAFKYPEK